MKSYMTRDADSNIRRHQSDWHKKITLSLACIIFFFIGAPLGAIIRKEETRRYVVPSAPGKRFDGDIKVTDMLYECYRAAEKGEKVAGKIKKIQARYQEIIDGLGLDLKLDEQFAEATV